MANLYVVASGGRIFQFAISKAKVTIGRSKDNDVTLPDHTVSRHHAEIIRRKASYFLADLGSYNGTVVNGKPVQVALLKHKDRIEIGVSTLTFLEKDEERDTADSVVLTTDQEEGKSEQKIVQSSPQQESGTYKDLLYSSGAGKGFSPPGKSPASVDRNVGAQTEFSTLTRSNKVLFVLYEITRQLNQIHDFKELLKRMMDLIFMVIDADYGVLILTGGREDELIPVVVKQKGGAGKSQKRLKASRTILDRVIHDKVALLTSNAMADSRFEGAKSLLMQKIRSAMCVPLWRKEKIIGVIQLESVRMDNQFTQEDLELLKAIGSQMAMVIEQATLNEQIRHEEYLRARLERFHSPQVIDMILQGGQEAKDYIMEPKEHTATVLFSDIIGFTRLAEKMPPREVNIFLNRYFSRMSDIIFRYGGTLDKYMGDGLMAVFGAPMEGKHDEESAIRAALHMRRELAEMMSRAKDEKKFNVRIGINTGRVVAGNIGSPKRMDYTVIGDPVNIASRLESIAGPNQIFIGEETYKKVRDRFQIRQMGPRKVKGKSEEIMVYEILG